MSGKKNKKIKGLTRKALKKRIKPSFMTEKEIESAEKKDLSDSDDVSFISLREDNKTNLKGKKSTKHEAKVHRKANSDDEDLNDDNSKWDEYDSNKVAYYINAVEGSTTNRNYFTLGYGGFCKKAVKPSNENFSLITDGKNVSIESVTKINSFEELKKLVDSVCGPNDHQFIDYEK